MTFVGASDNGRREGNRVHWVLGDAPAGMRRSVTLELTADKPTEAVYRVTAKADRGVKQTAESKTSFGGAAGIHMEIDKSAETLLVGGEVDFTITILNRGTAEAKNLQLAVTTPDQLRLVSKDGPSAGTASGPTVTFAPLAALDAGKDATYKVHVKGLQPGEVKVAAEATWDDLAKPLREEEGITIFGEAAAPPSWPPAPPMPGSPP